MPRPSCRTGYARSRGSRSSPSRSSFRDAVACCLPRSEERLSLAAIGRRAADETIPGEQVQSAEALAELAGLRVAQPDAVADPQPARRRIGQRRLLLAGALAPQ